MAGTDYKSQIMEKADLIVALSYKLIDSAPKSDHRLIYELKQLGEEIHNTCKMGSEFGWLQDAGQSIERSISQYHQKYGYYSSEIRRLLEELKSLASEWFKSTTSKKDYALCQLEDQIQEKILMLQDKTLFEETDSEFLVPLGKILSRKFGNIFPQLSPPHDRPHDHFKKIESIQKELGYILELFQGPKDELDLIESLKSKHVEITHWLSTEGNKAINDTRTLFWNYFLEKLSLYSDPEVLERNDEFSVGVVINLFDATLGGVPLIGIPEGIIKEETLKSWFQKLANNSFAALGFVSPEEEKHCMFGSGLTSIAPLFIPQDDKMEVYPPALGYAFSYANPEATGGQENLSVCFVIKYPKGYEKENQKEREARYDTLQENLKPILDGMRLIRDLLRDRVDIKLVQKAMGNIRNFYTYAMIHQTEVKSEKGE